MGDLLKGRRGLVMGVANDHSIAWGIARAVAAEVTGTGVTMNSVSPTFVNTQMWKRWVSRVVSKTGRDPSEAEKALAESLPLGRVLEPDEVAAVVAFLASDDAAVINGQTLILDGGGVQG